MEDLALLRRELRSREDALLQLEALLDRAEKVISILPCGECDHSLSLHFDRYGCEYDLGDREGDESGPAYARGNCGCKFEDLSSDDLDAFMLLRDLRQLRLLGTLDSKIT